MAGLGNVDHDELASLAKNNWLDNKALVVYHQMLPDFPGPSIEFVKRSVWLGPIPVPFNLIDTSNRSNWTASYEPNKVKGWQDTIQSGVAEPIILGKLPNHSKYFIIDAHHRFLAYEALKKPPLAYIGIIPPDSVEAAITAHSRQYSGSSRLKGPSDKGAT